MVTVTMATIVQEATCPLVSVFLFVVLSSPTERPVRREKRGAVTDGWGEKLAIGSTLPLLQQHCVVWIRPDLQLMGGHLTTPPFLKDLRIGPPVRQCTHQFVVVQTLHIVFSLRLTYIHGRGACLGQAGDKVPPERVAATPPTPSTVTWNHCVCLRVTRG